jgi:hypothetical protein
MPAVAAFSQENVERTKQIAQSEKQRFDAARNNTVQSNASGNFVVNYYRCEWQVDPAVLFIRGTVTSYFKITSDSASSIVYDLSNQLIVDSVIFRKKKISFKSRANKNAQNKFSFCTPRKQKRFCLHLLSWSTLWKRVRLICSIISRQ